MLEGLLQLAAAHRDGVLLVLALVVVLLLVSAIVLISRVGQLNRRYARLTRNTSGGNIEELLVGHMDSVRNLEERTVRIEQQLADLEARQRRCLQGVGLVRFDAFEEVGGQQSFAVALMDGEESGVALSSVFSRSDVRIYAKSIEHGRPSHALTSEELKAMREAACGKQ